MAITKLQSSRDFFRIWFSWKKQATFVFVLIVGLVMFYAYTATPKYESTASVLLLPKTGQDLVITANVDARQVIQRVTLEDLNTEMGLILSDKVIHDTIEMFPGSKLGLKLTEQGVFDTIKDAIKGVLNGILHILQLKGDGLSPFDAKAAMLKRLLSVSVFESNIFEVTLKGEEPKQVALVLEKLLANYIKQHNQVFSIDEGLGFYDDQASVYYAKLNEAERVLNEFLQGNNIVNLAEQNAANISLFTELQKELLYFNITYDEAKTRIRIFSTALVENDDVLVTKEMRNIPTIVELEKGIIPLLIKRSELSKTFTKQSREYQDISDQITMLYGEIKNAIRKALAADKLELESMLAKKVSLQARLDNIRTQAVELKNKERVLQDLKRQAAFLNNKYMLYASKTEDSRIYDEKKKRNMANVNISDKPSVSANPVSPNKLMLLALSLFFGTVAALAVPFVLESLDHKLKTADDVEDNLGINVVSSFSDVFKP